jgi:hypothetical protein
VASQEGLNSVEFVEETSLIPDNQLITVEPLYLLWRARHGGEAITSQLEEFLLPNSRIS